ncbi:MAG: DegT/DnrJ/EryC1/StrS family aminotransferase [Candidatus Latescibacteria bacterium]|jgi:dTDP-4-amino-4,6-dideoxygalactose transaminase|nr:DegT/DnrJ/EryC1/StrS family aminotransferase [Candidatus Latescibacterota bacterium]MBT5831312.1 DegT/DnrJ/EryC1/StrS family aminotransferase [Candidatus Latescibacterota bacterium]
MAIPLIDLYAQYQSIKPEIDATIEQVIRDSAFIGGKYLTTFEDTFAAYCNVPYGIGASSGTTALHLVLAALDIGPGDEVITVPNTFIATVETIVQTGAHPVFVDVCDDTMNLDPTKLEAAITDKTSAIIPVHLYGQIADMDPIMEIAHRHGLAVIEDAAQVHGAEYKKNRAGHFGTAATFSFHPAKVLGAFGDAGIIVTKDEAFAKKLKMLANHGRIEKYEHEISGFNYRLDPLQAAILQVKLGHLETWLEKRRDHAHFYNACFENTEVRTPVEHKDNRHVYTYYVIRTQKRSKIEDALQKADIAAQIHYPISLHQQPAFKKLGYKNGDFPVAEKAADEILTLPLYPELKREQIQHIATQVLRVF